MIYRKNVVMNTEKCIAQAIEATSTARKKVQIAYYSIIFTMSEHKDTRKGIKHAKELINGTVGLNQKGLVDAFVAQGAKVDEKEGIIGWDVNMLSVDLAKDKEWHEYSPQKPYAGYDTEKALRAVLTNSLKAQKIAANDDEKAEVIKVPENLLEGLKQLLATG